MFKVENGLVREMQNQGDCFNAIATISRAFQNMCIRTVDTLVQPKKTNSLDALRVFHSEIADKLSSGQHLVKVTNEDGNSVLITGIAAPERPQTNNIDDIIAFYEKNAATAEERYKVDAVLNVTHDGTEQVLRGINRD